MEKESEKCFDLTDRGVGVSRKSAVHADIARRLRRVCHHLPETEFQSLVEEMTDRQLNGERRANEWLADSRRLFPEAEKSF